MNLARAAFATFDFRPQKGGSDKALGRSRGGLTTKIHLLVNQSGLPLEFRLTAGQVSDYAVAIELLGDRQPEVVIANKGYESDKMVEHVEATMKAEVVIPPRCHRSRGVTWSIFAPARTATREYPAHGRKPLHSARSQPAPRPTLAISTIAVRTRFIPLHCASRTRCTRWGLHSAHDIFHSGITKSG